MATSLVGKKIGNYNITKQLGEGGMGAVYLGEHPLIGKRVAVKVLHDELAAKQDIVSRFFTEAKAVNDIHHENIVDIVDFGQMKDDGGKDLVYFIMELLEGESLSDRLKKTGVTPPEAVHVIDQCASALFASHSHKIVHRDIKPDNIYLTKRGDDPNFVKLLDFGIAKLTGDTGGAPGMTRAGSVLGTPAYMSPEQCDGKGNIDHRSDIYSLGIVLFEMLCGRVPFVGEGFGQILVAQLTQPPPRPTEINANVPPGLEGIVMRCLEKDRNARFQTMDELRAALRDSEAYVPPRAITGANPILGMGTMATAMGQGVRPTTLSGAASEVRPGTGSGAAPRSKAPLFAGVGVIGLGAAAIAAYFGLHAGAPASDPPAAASGVTAPAPPKVESVVVMIDSTPQGATIQRAGQQEPLGKTPHEMKLKKGIPAFDVLLTLEGHKPETRTVTTDRDREMLIALTKVEPVTPPPAATEKPSSGSSGSSSSKGSKPVALPRLPSGGDEGGDIKPLPDKPKRSPDKPADPDGVLAPQL